MNIKTLCATLLLLIAGQIFLTGQDRTIISVPLQLTLQEEPTGKLVSLPESHPPKFVGIPKGLDTMLYWSFVSSWQQNQFDQYRKGNISEDEFRDRNIDPKYYTTENIDFKIWGLSGFRSGKKIIVMDTNHNFDFSDESILELDTTLSDEEKLADDYRLSPWLKTYLDYHEDGKTYRISITGRIDPFVKLIPSPGKLIEDLKFSFYSFEDYRGTVTLDKKKFNLRADRAASNGRAGDLLFSNYGLAANEQEDIFFPLQIGQKIFINGAHYEFSGFDLESNSLIIARLEIGEEEGLVGGRVGMQAPVYSGKIIGGTDSVQIGGVQGKYQFVHAWGTWCGPCLADHDELIRLYQNFHGENIEFIGLAVDRDLQTVSDYQQKKGIDWKNIFFVRREAFQSESVLVQQFYINAYPTYLIIDPEGTVMARGKLEALEVELRKIAGSE